MQRLEVSGTAPLASKRYILYIYSTNTGTEYFKHGVNSPSFSLQNAVCFIILTYLVLVLFTFYIQSVLNDLYGSFRLLVCNLRCILFICCSQFLPYSCILSKTRGFYLIHLQSLYLLCNRPKLSFGLFSFISATVNVSINAIYPFIIYRPDIPVVF